MTTVHIAAFFTDQAANLSETNARLAINVTTFLTILCWVFLFGFVISRFNSKLKKMFSDMFAGKLFFLAWLVPTTAMVFSLYFSEFLGWTPCQLCWYQRFFIYSLSLVTLIYYFKRIKVLRIIGYVLAAISPFISTYHLYIENSESESTFCTAEVSCAAVWFKSLGFLTIAGMALTAAITTGVLLYLTKESTNSSS